MDKTQMNAGPGSQTLSSSVTTAIDFLQKEAKLLEF